MSISTLITFLLPAYVLGACSYVCATCVNPFSYPSRTLCRSCYSGYLLVGYSCYDCEYCQYYGICSDCNQSTSSSASTTSIYAVIFGVLAGVTLVCVIIIFIYYRFCRGNAPMHAVAAQQPSSVQLAIPSNMKWTKSEKNINGGQNCAICLESSVILETKCGHLYHPKCIWEWCTKRQITCPLCKSCELEPVHLYCAKCASSFIEIRIANIPKVLEEVKWNICQSCKQDNL